MAEAKFTKSELAKKTVADLKELLEEEGLEADDDWKKADYVNALLEVEVDEDDEEDDEELDDTEESDEEADNEEDDEEEDEVEETKPASRKKSTAKAKPAASGGSDLLAAKQVATMIGTDAKTLRQFFRSGASSFKPVGSGGRYEFAESDVPKIKEEFDKWKAGHASRGQKRAEGSTSTRKRAPKGKAVEVVDEVDEVEDLEIEELEDPELEDEELELDDEEED